MTKTHRTPNSDFLLHDTSTRTLSQGETAVVLPHHREHAGALAYLAIEEGKSSISLAMFRQLVPGADRQDFFSARLELLKALRPFPSLKRKLKYDKRSRRITSDLDLEILVKFVGPVRRRFKHPKTTRREREAPAPAA